MSSRYATPLHDRFVPVPVRARADGWTEARQRGFVRALAEGASVTAAAARVGMSVRSAYRLHDRAHAGSFRRAWRVAQSLGAPAPEPARPVRWWKLHRWRGRVVHREERWNEVAVRRVLARHDSYSAERIKESVKTLARLEAERAELWARCLDAARARSREVLQTRWGCREAWREVRDLWPATAPTHRRGPSRRSARAPPVPFKPFGLSLSKPRPSF